MRQKWMLINLLINVYKVNYEIHIQRGSKKQLKKKKTHPFGKELSGLNLNFITNCQTSGFSFSISLSKRHRGELKHNWGRQQLSIANTKNAQTDIGIRSLNDPETNWFSNCCTL